MKIEGFARFFAERSSVSSPSTEQAKGSPAGAGSSDAVTISPELGSSAAEVSARQARVAQLKQEVSAGTYQPDTRAVAEALAQDLFA